MKGIGIVELVNFVLQMLTARDGILNSSLHVGLNQSQTLCSFLGAQRFLIALGFYLNIWWPELRRRMMQEMIQ